MTARITLIESQLDTDEYLEVHRRKHTNSNQPFMQCFGRKSMYPQDTRPEFDVTSVMKSLASDQNATWLFWHLVELNDYTTNVSIINRKDLTKAESAKLAKGYKVLSSLGMVVRIKNNHYLFNPSVVVPGRRYLEAIQLHWLQLTSSQE